jgi:hypothetical protein
MSIQLETVLVSGVVAIIVAFLTVAAPFSIGRKQLKQKEFQVQLDKFRDEQKNG